MPVIRIGGRTVSINDLWPLSLLPRGESGKVLTGKGAGAAPAWETPTGGSGTPGDTVVHETSFGATPAAGSTTPYSRSDHTHGSPTDPVTAHLAATAPHATHEATANKGAASGYAPLGADSKVPAENLPPGGSGDMLKSTYDPNADGVIAKAQLDTALANTSGSNTGDQTLAGLGGIAHSLAIAVNDFLVASGAGAFVKKTLAETIAILNWAADIATHAALTTAHAAATNLEKTAMKGAVSGYAPLDTAQKVPTANLGGIGADGTKFLKDTQSWVNLAESNVTNLVTDLAAKEATANKGAVSGYAGLDAAQKVPTVNLGGAGADATKYLRGDQAWVTPAGGGESEVIVVKVGDTQNATTTYADAAGLTFTAVANKTYIIEAWVRWATSALTVGIKLSVNGPATPGFVADVWNAALTTSLISGGGGNAYNVGGASASAFNVADNLAMLNILFRCGAAGGPVTVRFACETTGTVTCKDGSVLRYRQVT